VHPGSHDFEDDPTFAPSCKRCNRVLDHQFPSPTPADTLEAVVRRGLVELGVCSSLLIDGVPTDQMELLRSRLRKEARQRGWKFQSTARDGMLLAMVEGAVPRGG